MYNDAYFQVVMAVISLSCDFVTAKKIGIARKCEPNTVSRILTKENIELNARANCQKGLITYFLYFPFMNSSLAFVSFSYIPLTFIIGLVCAFYKKLPNGFPDWKCWPKRK